VPEQIANLFHIRIVLKQVANLFCIRIVLHRIIAHSTLTSFLKRGIKIVRKNALSQEYRVS